MTEGSFTFDLVRYIIGVVAVMGMLAFTVWFFWHFLKVLGLIRPALRDSKVRFDAHTRRYAAAEAKRHHTSPNANSYRAVKRIGNSLDEMDEIPEDEED